MNRKKQIPANHPYPNFISALLQYGEDGSEIGRALGISPKSVYLYMNGDGIPKANLLKIHPVLDEALTKDFAHLPKQYPQKRSENSSQIAS